MKKTKIKKLTKKRWLTDKVRIRRLLYILWGLILVSSICFIIVWGGGPYGERLNEGDIGIRNIYSPFSFTIKGEIDEKTTNRLRQQAAKKVKDVYIVNDKAEKQGYHQLDSYFKEINSFKQKKFSDESEKKELFNKQFDTSLNLQQINLVLNFNLDKLQKKAKRVLKKIFSQGVISSSKLEQLKEENIEAILINRDNREKEVQISKILTPQKVDKAIYQNLTEYFGENRDLGLILSVFILKVIQPNIEFSQEITQNRKAKAKSKILPKYKKLTVKKSELIVEKGERVNPQQIKILNTINKLQQRKNRIWFTLGVVGITILFTLILLLSLYIYQPSLFNGHNLLLIALLCLILIGIAKGITISPLSSYLIPLASVSMLTIILLNFPIAILVTGILSFITGLIVGDGLSIGVVFFSSGILSTFMLRKVRSRIKILQAALIVSIVNFIMISLLGFFQNLDYSTFLTQGLWGIGGGFFSGLLVMGLLPLFEYGFNITTDISLLEKSDLNHPLLKKMILKAPGTYHHSLIVGNLSEAGCDAIGANSLLARVASYFHDIGKIEKAEYFSENQTRPRSKHDKLTPDMSKLIIIKHVKDGIELAQKYKLKQAIIDIIAQHHGTGLVFYFFQRALNEKVDESEIDEEYYRYPGPQPQTKEAAVVLLADSVEAASRALSSPTPARIKGMVRKVINNKFIDGQLDQCDLTLKELNKIATIFIRILTGIFHSRIEYPEKLQKKSQQNERRYKK